MKQKDELEDYFNGYVKDISALNASIEATDNEINKLVYKRQLFKWRSRALARQRGFYLLIKNLPVTDCYAISPFSHSVTASPLRGEASA